jgi:hypothetical protein
VTQFPHPGAIFELYVQAKATPVARIAECTDATTRPFEINRIENSFQIVKTV